MESGKKFLLCWAESGTLKAALTDGVDIAKRGEFELATASAAQLAEFGSGAQAAVCPGGCLGVTSGGTHRLTEAALSASADPKTGRAPADIAMAATAAAAEALGIPAYYTEAMSADELLPLCRIGSHAMVPKFARGYRAEHLAMLRMAYGSGAADDGNYIAIWADDLVSVGAYSRGRCLDINDCIGAEGPMGFTSSGDVPCAQLSGWFASHDNGLEDMRRKLLCESGILGYTGVSEPDELDKLCESDENARLAVKTMAYQICKWAGSSALVLGGKVDGIAIGGKGARCESLIAELKRKLGGMAPIAPVAEIDMAGWLTERVALLGSFAEPVM